MAPSAYQRVGTSLLNEFQDSQSDTVRPGLKNKEKTPTNQQIKIKVNPNKQTMEVFCERDWGSAGEGER